MDTIFWVSDIVVCRQRFQPCAPNLDRVIEQREQIGDEARVVGAAVGEAEQPCLQHLKQPEADRCLGIADQLLCGVCVSIRYTWSGTPFIHSTRPKRKRTSARWFRWTSGR